MTAHLALNMIWLWLFLRDTRASHALAAGVAFVACGLHQVVFHPLFAAPFLISLLVARRWTLATWYGAVYAAIGLFWILYWSLVLRAASAPLAQSADVGIAFFIQRIVDSLNLGQGNVALMAINLLRFLAWQSPLAIVLAVVGYLTCRNRNRITTDLALGIAFTLGLMLILMPYQGHGWGYRYLHGFLGSLCLLAAQGWVCMTDRGASAARQPAFALVASVFVSLFALFPWRVYEVREVIKPYVAAVETIKRADADVVVVDPTGFWFAGNLVRNDPFLRTSPKVLALSFLSKASLTDLCRRYDVAIFDRHDAQRLGLRMMHESPRWIEYHQNLRDLMSSLGCGRAAFARRSEGKAW
jgi:hypothetical protein